MSIDKQSLRCRLCNDVEAGLVLGQAVGELAVARGQADGSDATWDGSGRLTGEGYWIPTPPRFVENSVEPLGGTWETWGLPSGDAVRPAPPPEYGSPLWQAEAEVDLLAAAAEAAAQRCWSGIHFPIDDDIGLEMGFQVGRLVNTVARADGAG